MRPGHNKGIFRTKRSASLSPDA